MVPLSFDWDGDGDTLLFATPSDGPTGRNLAGSRTIRLTVGPTRDVVMIDGTVGVLELAALDGARGDAFAARTGFDMRALSPRYRWFRVTPRRVQAWREADELAGRDSCATAARRPDAHRHDGAATVLPARRPSLSRAAAPVWRILGTTPDRPRPDIRQTGARL